MRLAQRLQQTVYYSMYLGRKPVAVDGLYTGEYTIEYAEPAQGIYDQCTPVSASEAKAGDIIFFTGTYNSAGAVSHVGIYCGNGVMIHCGDPIKYASINTPYWQSHFYSFGRLN